MVLWFNSVVMPMLVVFVYCVVSYKFVMRWVLGGTLFVVFGLICFA